MWRCTTPTITAFNKAATAKGTATNNRFIQLLFVINPQHHRLPKTSKPPQIEHKDSGFRQACERFPVRSGTEALENVNLVSIRADQDARIAAFHSAQNPGRSHLGRSSE